MREIIEIRSHAATPIYVLLIHIVGSYCAYIISKFACKIVIQGFSFAFPVTLTVPLTVTLLISGKNNVQKKILFENEAFLKAPLLCLGVVRKLRYHVRLVSWSAK